MVEPAALVTAGEAAAGPMPPDADRKPALSLDAESLASPDGATRDSLSVAAWTMISRATGVVRVAVIGAVLGPTFFSNAFQFANVLPNLIFYTFLAGSLFSSLLVPALVGHIDSGDARRAQRIACGFLGLSFVALLPLLPVALIGGPAVLRWASGSHEGSAPAAQLTILVALLLPQVFLYAVVGTATAVMNAHRRFALAAAAPAIENIGVIGVLIASGLLFGTAARSTGIPDAELLLLGLGSTAAVVLHAVTQWWGAHRVGITLAPRPTTRDPEIRQLIARALPSLGQAGLFGLQVLVMLSVVSRVPGGVVGFQIAMNFYALPIAIGATPVALALTPRLSRLHQRGQKAQFRDTLVRGYALALFITVPAAVGFLVMAHPLATLMAAGRMGTPQGIHVIAVSIAALAPAVIAQTVFLVSTYGSYSRGDTRTPAWGMVIQTVLCLSAAAIALSLHGAAVPLCLGCGYSAAVTASAATLYIRLRRRLKGGGETLRRSLGRLAVAGFAMGLPAWAIAVRIDAWLPGRSGAAVALVATTAAGAVIYLAAQVAFLAPELDWVAASLPLRLRGGRHRASLRTAEELLG